MDASVNGPLKQARIYAEWVWLEGAVALKEGQGVCYNSDYGTAASAEAQRYNRVELPGQGNARHFAGVAARNYAACAGGQLIEIYRPGSVCNILLKADVVLGVGIITCQAGGAEAGYFTRAGFEGEGSAVPLQTVSAASTAARGLAVLQVGGASGLIEVVTPVAGANTLLVGGVTFLQAATLASDAEATLADGTILGVRKGLQCEGAMTTSTVVLTVTNGEQRARDTDGAVVALTSVTFDADAEDIVLKWNGIWNELYSVGATLAST